MTGWLVGTGTDRRRWTRSRFQAETETGRPARAESATKKHQAPCGPQTSAQGAANRIGLVTSLLRASWTLSLLLPGPTTTDKDNNITSNVHGQTKPRPRRALRPPQPPGDCHGQRGQLVAVTTTAVPPARPGPGTSHTACRRAEWLCCVGGARVRKQSRKNTTPSGKPRHVLFCGCREPAHARARPSVGSAA